MQSKEDNSYIGIGGCAVDDFINHRNNIFAKEGGSKVVMNFD